MAHFDIREWPTCQGHIYESRAPEGRWVGGVGGVGGVAPP
jgi:hypothetical protein